MSDITKGDIGDTGERAGASEATASDSATVVEVAPDGSERMGIFMLVALVVVAFPLLMVWGEGQWFSLDEWSFIANRSLPSAEGFFGSHNGHWVTIPLVMYRVNYEFFGLHSYVPYQLWVVAAHLTIVVLAHIAMRRMAVPAWIATLMAVGFVFYGAGWGNILFAFQITLNGSVIAGLAQLLLTDHDGAWSRRDVLGLVVAVLGLMTSAVMPALSVGVGVFLLIRRGWRIAAVHTAVPAAVFLGWYVAFGTSEGSDPQLWRIIQFVFHMVRATFLGFGRNAVGGFVLAAVAVVGLGAAVQAWRTMGESRALAIAAGLVSAVLAFASLTGFNRSGSGVDIAATASIGRYLHVCGALLLPVIALGAAQLWRWRKPLVAIPLLAIVFGLPANIDSLRNRSPFTTGNRSQVIAVAHSDLLEQVPPDFKPLAFQDLRASWLLREARAGNIPEPGPNDGQARIDADAIVALAPASGDRAVASCTPEASPAQITLAKGDVIHFGGPVALSVVEGEMRSRGRTYGPATPLLVQAGPIDVAVRATGDSPLAVCVQP